jgi:hypothetical protein
MINKWLNLLFPNHLSLLVLPLFQILLSLSLSEEGLDRFYGIHYNMRDKSMKTIEKEMLHIVTLVYKRMIVKM